MRKEESNSGYRFADCLGKKVLITGDLGSGKTALLAKLLDEAINSKLGAKIAVIDMAPGERIIDSYLAGKSLREYLKNLDLVQYMAPKNVHAPRLDGKSKDLVEKLDTVEALLKDLVILQAMQAGIPGGSVRQFLGVDMNRVTQVSKMLKQAKKH